MVHAAGTTTLFPLYVSHSLSLSPRYNDYKNDPLSACNCSPPYSAENAIAARSDLNPANGTYELPFLGHRLHGATDYKGTNYGEKIGTKRTLYRQVTPH